MVVVLGRVEVRSVSLSFLVKNDGSVTQPNQSRLIRRMLRPADACNVGGGRGGGEEEEEGRKKRGKKLVSLRVSSDCDGSYYHKAAAATTTTTTNLWLGLGVSWGSGGGGGGMVNRVGARDDSCHKQYYHHSGSEGLLGHHHMDVQGVRIGCCGQMR